MLHASGVCKPREREEPTHVTGLDPGCRERMRRKPLYPLLMAIGKLILEAFGVLIVVCNHGKHRSVVLACDIAHEAGATLLTPCHRSLGDSHMNPRRFMQCIAEVMRGHIRDNGRHPFLINSIGVASGRWNGKAWATENGAEVADFLDVEAGQSIIELHPPGPVHGWTYAAVWCPEQQCLVSRGYLHPRFYKAHAGHLEGTSSAALLASMNCI